MSKVSISRLRAGVSAAVAGTILLSGIMPGVAAPMPVAPIQGAALALAGEAMPLNVGYRLRRHARHGHSGVNGAVALGILGLGVAAIIAANGQHRRSYDDYGYEPRYRPAYEPAYDPNYEPAYDPNYDPQPYYQQPQVVYVPPAPVYEVPRYRRDWHRNDDRAGQDDMYSGDRGRRHWDHFEAPVQPSVVYQQPAPYVAAPRRHYEPVQQVQVQPQQDYRGERAGHGGWGHVPRFECPQGVVCGPRH